MALAGGRWVGVVTFADNSGKTTSRSYELAATGANEADKQASAGTIMAALLAALANVTDCAISRYFFYHEFNEGSLSLPAAGVQKENNAIFNFDIVGAPNKAGNVLIPAPKIGIMVATTGKGADILDTTDAAVIALRDLYITGPSLFISDGETANSLLGGHRLHKANPNS